MIQGSKSSIYQTLTSLTEPCYSTSFEQNLYWYKWAYYECVVWWVILGYKINEVLIHVKLNAWTFWFISELPIRSSLLCYLIYISDQMARGHYLKAILSFGSIMWQKCLSLSNFKSVLWQYYMLLKISFF